MSFQPVVPMGGLAGWRFLERTLERQETSHARSPAALRDEAYFRENIGKIDSAADLVADRRLLKVTLTAFGLSEDLPNRAYIQRILESDTSERRSFANRLSDKRYLEMAKALGFGDGPEPKTRDAAVVEKILTRARERRFEEAVGTQNESMRLALALRRDLTRVARDAGSDDAAWFTVLGTPSLRSVFETAFGLPREFAALDIDKQSEIIQGRVERLTGSKSITQFTEDGAMDQLIRRFFVGTQLAEINQITPGSSALSLLQAIPPMRSLMDRR